MFYKLLGCYPDDCKQGGNEVRWDYEDFEPIEGLISIDIMLPSIWRKILTETERTTANPSDGEAWGRLGKAYKEAIMAGRGFAYYGLVSAEMYQLSQDAYQKAITLLPNDADWHYGFAELLCRRAEWGYYGEDVGIYSNNSTSATIISSWMPCAEQLKLALDINPEHAQANKLLSDVDNLFRISGGLVKFVDLSESQPDYLILTPQPTAKNTVIEKTRTPTVTPVKTRLPSLTPSDTPQPEQTKIIPTTEVADHMAELQTLETATEEIPSSYPQTTKISLYVGIILVLVIVAVGFIVFRKR